MSSSFEIQAAVIIEDDEEMIYDQAFSGCPYWIALFKLCRHGERLMWQGSSLILSGGGYRTREEAEKEFMRSPYKDISLAEKTHFRTSDKYNLHAILIPYEEYPL